MEIRVLYYFLTVANEGNITRAAELLHITQPTLSRQLMQLEQELGVTLFQRNNHKMQLTEDGLLLKERASDIVSLAQKTKDEFTLKAKEHLYGKVLIGSGEAQSIQLLAKCIHDFHMQYPFVQFDLYTANAEEIKERIDTGLVDIGILTEPVDISKYHFVRLPIKERWGILVREDSPLAQKKCIKPIDLVDVPLLFVKRPLVKNELENWFGEYATNMKVIGTYNLINNSAVMVENKVGVAICFSLGHTYQHLKFIPLYPNTETGSVLAWKKNHVLSKSAQCFLEAFKQYLKSIEE